MKKSFAPLLFALMIALPQAFSQPAADRLRNGFFEMKDGRNQQEFLQLSFIQPVKNLNIFDFYQKL